MILSPSQFQLLQLKFIFTKNNMTNYSGRQIEIIQAAGKIITQTGISSLTTKRLSKEMKFSESALYRHFSGKNEIIKAMLGYLADDMDARFSSFQSSETAPLEKLKFIFTNQLDFFVQKPFFVGVIFPENLLEESNDINKGIKKIMVTRKKHLIPTIAQCQNEKLIRTDLTEEEISHILMGSFRLLTLKWRLSGFEFDITKKGEKLLSNLFKIIKPCEI